MESFTVSIKIAERKSKHRIIRNYLTKQNKHQIFAYYLAPNLASKLFNADDLLLPCSRNNYYSVNIMSRRKLPDVLSVTASMHYDGIFRILRNAECTTLVTYFQVHSSSIQLQIL